jgi:hypothetical protein
MGPKEYREQRALFLRLDELLGLSGIEADFFRFSMAHRKIDLKQCTTLEVQSLSRGCVLALRSNIARMITGMAHRDFLHPPCRQFITPVVSSNWKS